MSDAAIRRRGCLATTGQLRAAEAPARPRWFVWLGDDIVSPSRSHLVQHATCISTPSASWHNIPPSGSKVRAQPSSLGCTLVGPMGRWALGASAHGGRAAGSPSVAARKSCGRICASWRNGPAAVPAAAAQLPPQSLLPRAACSPPTIAHRGSAPAAAASGSGRAGDHGHCRAC